ncbi:MAG: hypothetical protein LUD18_09485 [Lachnospiraceae bacterium]|nr:hypothetical protein [Lachnospiraceae bacterium]
MKNAKKTLFTILFMAMLLVPASSVLAENQYYYVTTPVTIDGGGVYTAVVHAGDDGWMWNISENMDVTSWLVTEDGSPAFNETYGVAKAHLVYGPFEGEDEDVALELEITIDTSAITGFAENGSYDLYIMPTGKSTIWVCGENHGQYVDCMEQIGTVEIPTVTVDGLFEQENGELTNDTVSITLEKEDLDVSLLDISAAEVVVLEGSAYDYEEYGIDAVVNDDWEDGTGTVTASAFEGSFGMQGGDGNGHYNLRIGVTGITYNGLTLGDIVVRTDIYAYGRTFLSDNGSLIWYAEPEWDSEDEIPVLCDVYPDTFTVTWPVGMDASALTAEDVTITMVSEYDDELVLSADTDYLINASSYETEIVTTYIYWAYMPVYTTLRIEINTDNIVRDELMYADTEVFSHEYEIASVYVYSEMGGGQLDGAQGWTYYGFANLTDASQVFYPATYTLTYTDEDGNVWYYAEDEDGAGYLVDEEIYAVAFNCDEEAQVCLIGQTVNYVRPYGGDETPTEVKAVDGEEITFEKIYVYCEVLPRTIEDLDPDLELLPGYALGEGWEDHLKWSWQSFINEGYMSDNK